MSDTPAPVVTEPLLKMLCIGKLSKNLDGTFNNEQHELLSYRAIDTIDKSVQKAYKTHCKAIMSKGAQKLQIGKRIRLTSDDNQYDVHVLCESLDDNDVKCLVFFAICSSEFGKTQSITNLFRDYKNLFYEQYNINNIWSSAASNISTNDKLNSGVNKLFNQYNTNLLGAVSVKVEQVRDQMKESVARAITNVEQLEEMEEKSEEFEAQAKRFQKNSSKVKQMFCKRYATITILGGVVVLAIVIYIIYAVSKKS